MSQARAPQLLKPALHLSWGLPLFQRSYGALLVLTPLLEVPLQTPLRMAFSL